jgi:hypothetical protein
VTHLANHFASCVRPSLPLRILRATRIPATSTRRWSHASDAVPTLVVHTDALVNRLYGKVKNSTVGDGGLAGVSGAGGGGLGWPKTPMSH